jgi:hypothetical protein
MMARRKESPKVNGTKIKWYIAVAANCSRDKSTTVSLIMARLRMQIRRHRIRRRGIGKPHPLCNDKKSDLKQQDKNDFFGQTAHVSALLPIDFATIIACRNSIFKVRLIPW